MLCPHLNVPLKSLVLAAVIPFKVFSGWGADYILRYVHTFVLHTSRLTVDADYIPELDFSPEIFGAKGGAPMRLIQDRLR